jgi:hypothetical protein
MKDFYSAHFGKLNFRPYARFIFGLVLLLGLIPLAGNTQTINVTTTNDVVNPGDGVISLREAIIDANAAGAGSYVIINLPSGTYTLSIAGSDNTAAAGDLDVNHTLAGTKTVNIVGSGAANTVLTGTMGERIFDVHSLTAAGAFLTFNVDGVTFSGVNAVNSGAAILAGREGDVTFITNCIFTGNTASTIGGAISQSSSNVYHYLTIINCTFTNNTASSATGGAVNYNGLGSLNIEDCSFTGNTAGTTGGAINITGGGTGPSNGAIVRNTFSGNTANGVTFGGAVVSVVNAQTIYIFSNRIIGNSAPNVANGKMISTAGGTVGTMNTNNNWWGTNDGPSGSDILGTAASAWLQLKASSSLSTLCPAGTALVTAGFLSNSAGSAIAAGDLVAVIGLPISFSAALGNLTGAQTTIQSNGTATVTYTATGNGAGSVNAVVDNVPNSDATAKATINISSPVISSVDKTDPTCAAPAGGEIVVNATGTATLEYSINGGTDWFTTNTFSNLSAGSYTVWVRSTSNPTCVTVYSNNPVILNAATGCVVPTLSINDVTLNEGNSGTTTFTFTVSLSSPAGAGGVTFDIATSDGTAQDDIPVSEDNDFVAKSLTSQTIPAGSSTYTFNVNVNGDLIWESDETFFVNVNNVVGATVTDAQGQGTITNDDNSSCDMIALLNNISSCNNNGTPGNPADDYFTADVFVQFSGTPPTGTLRIAPGNPNVLDVVEIPVGDLVGNSHVFTGVRLRTTGAAFAVKVEFSADIFCSKSPTAPAVNSCSADCAISTASFSNVSSCNNNGTPANPADDYYTADLTVNFSNAPATGTLRIEPANPNVLDVVEIAVGSLVGNSHVFTGVRLRTTGAIFAVEVEFSADNACVKTIVAPAVSSCSADVCAISSASFSNVSSCNNNGTPSDPADDYYTADLTVNFANAPATGTLRIEPANPNVLDVVEIAVGSLVGNSHVFTGVRLRTTGAIFPVEVEFSAISTACVRTITAPAVSSCAVICTAPDITAPTVSQPTCALSTGTIVVNATGSGTLEYSINGGTSWFPTNTFSGLAPGSYNIAVRLESNPTCFSTYSGNPVVLNAASGCNTCVLTCPANIIKNNSWGKCGANVTYPAAISTGNCGTITYSHPSGSFFPVGTTTVTVSSSTGSSCTFTVTVKDVQKPTIKCPSDITVTTTTCSKQVTFSVSATDNCPGVTVATVPASGTVFPVGTTTVTATATDASGNKSTNTFKVKVKENTPPVIHTASSPIVLQWPANGSYQTINVSQFVLSVSDNCSNIPVSSVNITKVTSDEAEDAYGNADGNTRKDIKIAGNCKSVELRRERRTGGNGRVYTIYVSVRDASGNTATKSFKVFAPVNQGGTTATDNGAVYTVTCNCDDDDDDDDWRHRSIQAESVAVDVPEGFTLEQNIPNPFSSSTLIRYTVPEETKVSLAVYNNVGQKVAQLVDARVSAGYHQVKFESSKLAAGIYLYRLESVDSEGNRVLLNKKMIIAK